MPNQHSKAVHSPLRTCVICRMKAEQEKLLGFYLLDGEIVFDIKKAVQTRKRYVCHEVSCLQKLDKWLARYLKKNPAVRAG